MATGCVGVFSIAGAVLLGSSLWSWVPSWHTVPPAPQREIRVQAPVTDSVIASVDCNCFCQDNLLVVAFAFVSGIFTILVLITIFRCWCFRAQIFESPHVEYERSIVPELSGVEIEQGAEPERRTEVTPSIRRQWTFLIR